MNTLLLDRTRWDLVLDASGDIAMARNPYSIAQDVASAARLFAGELWYDTAKGVPYFEQILGKQPPLQLVKARIAAAAKTVPEVVRAVVYIDAIENRQLSGQIQIVDARNVTSVVSLTGETITII